MNNKLIVALPRSDSIPKNMQKVGASTASQRKVSRYKSAYRPQKVAVHPLKSTPFIAIMSRCFYFPW